MLIVSVSAAINTGTLISPDVYGEGMSFVCGIQIILQLQLVVLRVILAQSLTSVYQGFRRTCCL
jgi:hypothetical protein